MKFNWKKKIKIKKWNEIVAYFNPKNLKLSTAYSVRIAVVGVVFGGLLTIVLVRFSYISLLPSDLRLRLRTQASKQFETEVTLAAPRGQITDRHGRPLAVSILQPSLFIVPKRLPDSKVERASVAKQLGLPARYIEDLAKGRKNFVWVKRQMTPAELLTYGDLSDWREFVGVVEEPKRFYPEKELASHLVGVVGIDNKGLDGVEGLFNEQLKGDAIHAKVSRDARGKMTLTTPNGAVKPELTTKPVQLSIDIAIQSFAETALRSGVIKAKAKSGSAVVMDVASGELLAIASYPSFDLNDPPPPTSEKRSFHPVMDALEVGSIVKPIFIAKAIEIGAIGRHEKLFCENGAYKIPGKVIHDTHKHGWLTPSEIIKVSSNICTYKIMKRMGRQAFYETVMSSGLARTPGTGLPGEWMGYIEKPEVWKEVRFANMGFGQGIAMSPLQVTRSLAMIARGGKDKPVRLTSYPKGETPDPDLFVGPHLQYISKDVSKELIEMMKTVVDEEDGTGKLATIPGIAVAGKTGTAEKFSQITKSYSERTASFVGIAPADKPKLAIVVVIDEPRVRPAYGGTLAGPVFAEIGTKTIQYLNATGGLALDSKKDAGGRHDVLD